MTPATMPTAMARSRLATASSAVKGARLAISFSTGWPVRVEMPRSPWSRRPRKLRYCCQSGRSRPIWWRMLLIDSGEAVGPAITVAGAPGSSRSSEKTTVATPSSVGIATSARRTTYVTTPRCLLRALGGRHPGRDELLVRQADDALDLGRGHERVLLVVEEDPRRVVPDDLGS